MTVRWAPGAVASARRHMYDQDGMRAIVAAVAALPGDPTPAHGFHRGRYHRLRVGEYRILYIIDGDLITIERVDRVISGGLTGTGAPKSRRATLTMHIVIGNGRRR